ncbi:MAG: hypothetical protein ACKPKO_03320, partial [Candidatus Fonsibacter sp.]
PVVVVISCFSHPFLSADGGLGARVPCVTSDGDGVTQAATLVHGYGGSDEAEEGPLILAADLGGSEAQA